MTAHSTDAVLATDTVRWLETLPASHRPMRLCMAFPRVANQLACCWNSATRRDACLSELLVPERLGRKGFPEPVVRELLRLFDLVTPDVPLPDDSSFHSA